jgi:S1-C subfamily serine protease
VSADDHAISSLDDLHRFLTGQRIGGTAVLGILRGADRLDLSVRVSDRQR